MPNQYQRGSDGCQWLEQGQRCGRGATKYFMDSDLGYCEFHHRKVLSLRDWLVEFVRSDAMKKIAVMAAMFLFAVLPAFAQHTVVLSWTAPTGTPAAVSYNMYRATGACASGLTFTKINTAPITVTTFTDSSTALTPNATFCYQATAVSSTGVESVPSNQAGATIPGPPSAPTGLTVTSVQ
jgi:hypothetical protein